MKRVKHKKHYDRIVEKSERPIPRFWLSVMFIIGIAFPGSVVACFIVPDNDVVLETSKTLALLWGLSLMMYPVLVLGR